MTDAQAAESLGVGRMSVSRRRKQLGLPQKPKRPEDYYDLTEEQQKQLTELYSQGRNDYEVAKVMKLGRGRLREWREENSIPSKTNKKGLGEKDFVVAAGSRESGKTYEEIGRCLGVSRENASKFMKRMGYQDEEVYRPSHPQWVDEYRMTPIQRSLIIGDLFGDGTLVFTSKDKAYYQSGHSNYQEFFIRWKYGVLLPLSSNVGGKKDFSAFSIKTWTTSEIGEFRNKFYPKGTKTLCPEVICLLDEISLAVWYMGDGSLGRNIPYIHLGKQVDALVLSEEINKIFNLKSYVRSYSKENHIVFDGESFFKLTNKYILPQFKYKTTHESCGEFWGSVSSAPYISSEQYRKLNDQEKQEVISLVSDYYRKKGFPFPRCNKRELRKLSSSFSRGNSTAGFKVCNHYMPHRYLAKRYDSDPMKHWDDTALFRKFIENRLKYSEGYVSDASIRTGIQLKGVPANFSPATAKYIYDKYLPVGGSTLDFSSGYGGRLLGFLAAENIGSYTGVEPNAKSHKGLELLRDECSEFFTGIDLNNISIIKAPFEDVSEEFLDSSFDLVFSSPPYFGLEIYSDEDNQSVSRYPVYNDWLTNFWFLVISESYRVLKPEGHLVYTLGNYKGYDLVGDTLKFIDQTGFNRGGFESIPYKNVYLSSLKEETIFIFKKPKPA
jgi:SAM-dependent methyltransferase